MEHGLFNLRKVSLLIFFLTRALTRECKQTNKQTSTFYYFFFALATFLQTALLGNCMLCY